MRQIIPALLAFWIAVSIPAQAQCETIDAWIEEKLPALLEIYKDLHAHPEVSYEEAVTSKKLADLLRDSGYEVTTDVGGHGVVAVLKNGAGPTLMIRADMDGLPVTEQTELVYASQEEITTKDGIQTGVMHACGHDVHMTNQIGVAWFMATHRDLWEGTLVLICQPAEERGAGAKAMLEAGLLERFPKPDQALALHVSATLPSGTIGYRAGYAMANVDSVDITVHGRGGHGAYPQATIDPIVQAAELVMSLQTIVSREIKPVDPAVITVGAIHGGAKHNVISDRCDLKLTVRSYGEKVRAQLREAITRRANAIAQAYNAPEPTIHYSEGTPSLFNDQDLAKQMVSVFRDTLGEEQVVPSEPSMGGEDFGRYGLAGVPILMFQLGSVEQKRLDRFAELGQSPPSLHSPKYYPDIKPTLNTGLRAMIAGALDLLQAPAAADQRN